MISDAYRSPEILRITKSLKPSNFNPIFYIKANNFLDFFKNSKIF